MQSEFKLVTLGYGYKVIDIFWDKIGKKISFPIDHIVHPALDHYSVQAQGKSNLHSLRKDIRQSMPPGDREYLATLEHAGGPTIHNMILCDQSTKFLDYEDAISYATYLGKAIEELFKKLKPSVAVSGFDAFHSSMGQAVARKMNIPWFALSFSVIPKGHMGFTRSMDTKGTFSFINVDPREVRKLAEQTREKFISHQVFAPTIVTEYNLGIIIKSIPKHFANFRSGIIEKFTSRFDKYTRRSLSTSLKDYFRRRRNLLMLDNKSHINVPPSSKFFFMGLHMQPEMAIDVWAPFYSNQFQVIEYISRSMPPNYQLLVKLHKIDADNFSRQDLKQISSLPGVKLVSPFASSREFIERAAIIFSIQGTITLESALLGKPVLAFGETAYTDMPTVSRVGRITDLPDQIRQILETPEPGREEILSGFERLLSRYAPGCYNDWDVAPTDEEIKNLAVHFEALRAELQLQVDNSQPKVSVES